MIIQQVSIFLENKPGQLSLPCKVLAENHINITTACLADTHDFGILRLIIKESQKAIEILQQNGFTVNISDVIALSVLDVPGGLSKILEVIDSERLNVEYMYAFSRQSENQAFLIFRFSDPKFAIDTLLKNNVKVVDINALF